MQRLKLIRFAIAVIRDGVTLTAGIFLALYLPLSGNLEAYHVPLVIGLCGIPLVARGPAE